MPPSSANAELKKQVKAASDIADVIGTYIPVTPAGKLFKSLCPFHQDTRPSLQIDRTYQNYRCWACDARGDVFDFVMKFEKVPFPEAMRILATRAGIKLDSAELTPADLHRAHLLHVMKWAEDQYRGCLLDDPEAGAARTYLAERGLAGATVRQFGLGFAPLRGDWLVTRAAAEQLPPDLVTEVGLIGQRDENRGFYDRFRDRVMFPIRDVRGQTVGFGGRILPQSPLKDRQPKYYNSAETPLFNKSQVLYGLDLARHAGAKAGYLAIVEGYTDVMMAHQHGVPQVVATMGTALTMDHVLQLRRYVPKVKLVFDSDEAGEKATDKSQGLFWAQTDFEIEVCTLPDGLDPCDLLVKPGGAEVFHECLNNAKDVLEFKLDSLIRRRPPNTLEAQMYVVDAVLGFMALAEKPSAKAQMKTELAITRLSSRLGVRQEAVWQRFGEMKQEQRRKQREAQTHAPRPAGPPPGGVALSVPRAEPSASGFAPKAGPAEKAERQLLEMLLARPDLVPVARTQVPADAVTHTGLRRLLVELYALYDGGETPDLDSLRVRILDRPDLADAALRLQDVGRAMTEPETWLRRVLSFFDNLKTETAKQVVRERLSAGALGDDETVEFLRQFQAGGGRAAGG